MDAIKIANFKKAHSGRNFPYFRTLGDRECKLIVQRLADRLFGTSHNTGLEIVTALKYRGLQVQNADIESVGFNLRYIMSELGFTPNEDVLINWYRFDQIDEMPLADLSEFFDDIWYPGADYIDVFDTSLRWTISVGYSGEILALELL